MSFSDILKQIFSFLETDWIQTIIGILYAGGGAGVITAFIKLRSLHKTTDTDNKKVIKSTSNSLTKIEEKQNKLENQSVQTNQQLESLTTAVTCLGDIISSVFLSSKAVSDDTKKAISKSVSKLMDLGLDLKTTSNIVEGINKAVQITKEVVDVVVEEQHVVAEESKQNAETTEEKSFEIYNKILEENNEQ